MLRDDHPIQDELANALRRLLAEYLTTKAAADLGYNLSQDSVVKDAQAALAAWEEGCK